MTVRERTLALEVRPTTFGFVVIEGVSTLLDWGVRRRRGTWPVKASFDMITDLIAVYHPRRIVLRRRRASSSSGNHGAARRLLRMVRAEAQRRGIEMIMLNKHEVKSLFKAYGHTTKHGIASILAEWFEELAWRLPPKRKPWHSERYNTLIFDATASAIAFLARA
jgi:hypothetical protein